MTKIPAALHTHINNAYPNNLCLVATVLSNGYPQMTPRGSVCVLDENTMGFWNRGGGTTAGNLHDGDKVTIYYRNSAIREILPSGGIARFYGTAEVHRSGDWMEKVWTTMIKDEREKDPEKKGHAVVIRIERAEHMNGKPLA